MVNVVGITQNSSILDTNRETWDKVINVNLTGTFNVIKASIPYLRKSKGSSIINISSTAGILSSYGYKCAYNSSKAGVIAFTKVAAKEEVHNGIRINSVAPGIIWIYMSEKSYKKDPEILKVALTAIPMGRGGKPAEVAKVVAFLAPDNASYITGQVI